MNVFDERSEDNGLDETMDEIKDIHVSVKAQVPALIIPARIILVNLFYTLICIK